MYIDERTIITLITYHAYFITTLPLLYIISGDEDGIEKNILCIIKLIICFKS